MNRRSFLLINLLLMVPAAIFLLRYYGFFSAEEKPDPAKIGDFSARRFSFQEERISLLLPADFKPVERTDTGLPALTAEKTETVGRPDGSVVISVSRDTGRDFTRGSLKLSSAVIRRSLNNLVAPEDWITEKEDTIAGYGGLHWEFLLTGKEKLVMIDLLLQNENVLMFTMICPYADRSTWWPLLGEIRRHIRIH